MTAVIIQSNKIVLNEAKTTKYYESHCREKNHTNTLANPVPKAPRLLKTSLHW